MYWERINIVTISMSANLPLDSVHVCVHVHIMGIKIGKLIQKWIWKLRNLGWVVQFLKRGTKLEDSGYQAKYSPYLI